MLASQRLPPTQSVCSFRLSSAISPIRTPATSQSVVARNALEHRSAKAVHRYVCLRDLDLPGSPSVFAFRLLSALLTLQPLHVPVE
jgi:hypothetical protein